MSICVRPLTVKKALPFIKQTHRRLPTIQGGMWAVGLYRDGALVGCALVGRPARVWDNGDTLNVMRVAVQEGQHNGCSMLYAACSKAAKAMGAQRLVTYTHGDEHGTSLKASGWIDDGMTDGGEYDRPSRARQLMIDPEPKRRWLAPWSTTHNLAAAAAETRPI